MISTGNGGHGRQVNLYVSVARGGTRVKVSNNANFHFFAGISTKPHPSPSPTYNHPWLTSQTGGCVSWARETLGSGGVEPSGPDEKLLVHSDPQCKLPQVPSHVSQLPSKALAFKGWVNGSVLKLPSIRLVPRGRNTSPSCRCQRVTWCLKFRH